jgi:hypothetical protein
MCELCHYRPQEYGDAQLRQLLIVSSDTDFDATGSMSTKTQLLFDQTFTKLRRMLLKVSANNLQQLYSLLNEQLKTFDLNGFKQPSATVLGSKTDTDFPSTQRLYFNNLNNTG